MSCSVLGCDAPGPYVRGWCRRHYQRWLRHFDPLGGRPSPGEPLAWARAHVARGDWGEGCIFWPFGSDDEQQYGYIIDDGRQTTASRWVCREVHGDPANERLETAHSCRRPACVNPRHLRWATVSENARDRIVHGTWLHGETCHAAKLTEEAVRQIKATSPGADAARDLGRQFNVSPKTIRNVWRGDTWAWLES